MSQIKNPFLRHMVMWIITLPFVASLLMPAVIATEYFRIPASEQETLRVLGQSPQAITERANASFTAMFIDTGVYATVEKLFRSKGHGIGGKGQSNIAKTSNRYLEGLWSLIYRAIWRFMGLWPVLSVLMLAIALPALIDGVVARECKLDQFKPHNPVIFWGSAHLAIFTMGAFLFLPLLPFPISLGVLYGSVGLVAMALWTTMANLQTGT